jgi:predicted transcriptional regulator
MDAISLKPERRAQLEAFAHERGKDPAEALDDALAAFFDGELRDFEEAAEGIRRGYEDAQAGRHRSASAFLEELRVKHDLPR